MRGRSFILAVGLAVGSLATQALASGGSFERVKAKGSISADAVGKVVGEAFHVPASSTRTSTKDLDEHPIADAINFSPDVLYVGGVAGGGYAATVKGNVISGSASGAVATKAKDGGAEPNSVVMTSSASLTFDFTLARTVAADLAVGLRREKGVSNVRASLTGPAMQPRIGLNDSGDTGRKLILPPGNYRLTFTHLTAAAAESDSPEQKGESQGSATFSLAVDPCGADCNGDNTLDLLDFICFQERIKDKHAKADLNGDGTFDLLDMVVFQELFAGGCE